MYERPEILEVGQASVLTLGTHGSCADKCECSLAADQQLPSADQPTS